MGMAIPHDTVEQLANEGITHPDDLADFDKDSLKQVADNSRNPRGRIANLDPNAPAGSSILRPPFIFGAKSKARLLAACNLIRFYATIGRGLTPGAIRWDPVIQNFQQQWKALEDRKDGNDPEAPKVSKGLPIIKWTKAFTNCLSRKIGARTIPLSH